MCLTRDLKNKLNPNLKPDGKKDTEEPKPPQHGAPLSRHGIVSPPMSRQCLGGASSSNLNSRDSQKRQY